MTKRFVLDASLAISFCIEAKSTQVTEAILDSFSQGTNAVVPSLWVWEVSNVLLMAERTGRLSTTKRHHQIALLKKLPIGIDEDAHKQAWNDTAMLAQTYSLSVYDASYLELALRLGLPLGSLDKDLRNAAKKAGVKCLPAKL